MAYSSCSPSEGGSEGGNRGRLAPADHTTPLSCFHFLCLSPWRLICRDRRPAGVGDAGRGHEPAGVSAGSAAPLRLPAEPDRGPQPAEPRAPTALLAPPPQPALHGGQPAELPAAR